MFMVCPFDALGSTMATYSGQNVGATKFERVKKGLISASVIGSIYSVLIFVALPFIANYLIYLIYDSWFFFTFEANRKLKKKSNNENHL